MNQKVVIRIASMNTPKSRTKAMQIAVGMPGVKSVELSGDNKDQIVVIGEGIDATCLTKLLRKKIGFTELVSVAKVEEKKPAEKEKKPAEKEKKPDVQPACQYSTPYMFVTEVHDRYQDPTCTIL